MQALKSKSYMRRKYEILKKKYIGGAMGSDADQERLTQLILKKRQKVDTLKFELLRIQDKKELAIHLQTMKLIHLLELLHEKYVTISLLVNTTDEEFFFLNDWISPEDITRLMAGIQAMDKSPALIKNTLIDERVRKMYPNEYYVQWLDEEPRRKWINYSKAESTKLDREIEILVWLKLETSQEKWNKKYRIFRRPTVKQWIEDGHTGIPTEYNRTIEGVVGYTVTKDHLPWFIEIEIHRYNEYLKQIRKHLRENKKDKEAKRIGKQVKKHIEMLNNLLED